MNELLEAPKPDALKALSIEFYKRKSYLSRAYSETDSEKVKAEIVARASEVETWDRWVLAKLDAAASEGS
jgi:pantoate kinase